ncbi:endolytic transglycosylase MltG [Siminovitchia acidinfaciens]|uniref:Endolytic murein transglycosylase n=1 Tax=Siminovitchia acidinfaciens TaxID=2321395 RepID=A0A429XYU7_9BACI|nr:endolytic transglycosylase MltG [Siminovitchia acidinfaciens]RST73902.1 endolytic transglycosylase MltG [Siminovitchia acidinfaciens]
MEKEGNEKIDKQARAAAMRENLLVKRSEAIIIRKIVGIITLTFGVLLCIVALSGFLYIKSALKPVDAGSDKEIKVEVPIGSSTTSIGKLLENKGVIKNASVFKYYVKFNNISGFQAGTYTFTPSMSLEEISQNLQTGILSQKAIYKITVPEGYSLDQIAGLISKQIGKPKKEIVSELDNKELLKHFQGQYPDLLTDDAFGSRVKHPLEGYLYPATYSYYEEKPTLEAIIDPMIKKTHEVLIKYSDKMEEKDVNVHELLTMASLIEKEATEKADRHMISSVFYNRLDEDMPLQTDPTVLYALGKHKERTLYKDLEVDSPYNTYKVKGLPPGPISNAGESSIEAALNPAESKYLYFLAEHGTGEVHYAKTLKEHNELKAKYITDKRK